MKLPYDDVHLIADPLYGYLRITLSRAGEIAEADIIDSPWVQRLKRIHQLQSSWWVFPTAEHSRFSHSLGVMHLAGQLAQHVYPTLVRGGAGDTVAARRRRDDAPRRPAARRRSRPVQPLLRRGVPAARLRARSRADLAAPDRERAGRAHRRAAAQPERRVRRRRAQSTRGTWPSWCGSRGGRRRRAAEPAAAASGVGPVAAADPIPRWVRLLHRALSGAVTVDNLDYVRRDAYMCGVSLGPIDPERLIYYTFCTAEGLTFHKRALSALRAVPQRALLHVRERVLPPGRARHRHPPARDLPSHARHRAAAQPSRRHRRVPPADRVVAVHDDGGVARRAARQRAPPARRGVAVDHPPSREVQHGVRARRRAPAAGAGDP